MAFVSPINPVRQNTDYIWLLVYKKLDLGTHEGWITRQKLLLIQCLDYRWKTKSGDCCSSWNLMIALYAWINLFSQPPPFSSPALIYSLKITINIIFFSSSDVPDTHKTYHNLSCQTWSELWSQWQFSQKFFENHPMMSS